MMINNPYKVLFGVFLALSLIFMNSISYADLDSDQGRNIPGIPTPEQYLHPTPPDKPVEPPLNTQPTPKQYNPGPLIIPPTVIDGRIKSVPQPNDNTTNTSATPTGSISVDDRVKVGRVFSPFSCGQEIADLAVSLINTTTYKIDAKICFERTGGRTWNCGVRWGIPPGESWSHSSCYTTGKYFYDVRGSTEQVKFRMPPE